MGIHYVLPQRIDEVCDIEKNTIGFRLREVDNEGQWDLLTGFS